MMFEIRVIYFRRLQATALALFKNGVVFAYVLNSQGLGYSTITYYTLTMTRGLVFSLPEISVYFPTVYGGEKVVIN